MIENYFRELGFPESETRVYLALAEVGKSTAQLLAKRLHIPRTTAYSILNNLVQKGIVSEEKRSATTFFTANKPSALLLGVQQQKERILAQEKTAKELVDLVSPYFRGKHFSVPKLQFFDGRVNVRHMLFENMALWQQSMYNHDSTWWGYQDHSLIEQYRDWLEFAWKAMAPQERVHLLSNKAPIEKTLKGKIKGREIYQLLEGSGFSSTTWVCGDYIVLVMTSQEPHYAYQLHDPVFASNLRTVFKLFWEQVA